MNLEALNVQQLISTYGQGQVLLAVYIAGMVIIGLPMAIISAWCYWLEDELDEHRFYWPLKVARNFIHPGSFVFLPDCEHEPRRNYRMNYEGPIQDILDQMPPGSAGTVLYYVLASSIMWPARLFMSLISLGLMSCFAAIYIAVKMIYLPFFLLRKLCEGICWLFK